MGSHILAHTAKYKSGQAWSRLLGTSYISETLVLEWDTLREQKQQVHYVGSCMLDQLARELLTSVSCTPHDNQHHQEYNAYPQHLGEPPTKSVTCYIEVRI